MNKNTINFVMAILIAISTWAYAQDDTTELRNQLEDQRTLIQKQSDMLKNQQQMIDKQTLDLNNLSNRLNQVESQNQNVSTIPSDSAKFLQGTDPNGSSKTNAIINRDSVGDLNADAVKAGDFPGSIKIPGTENLSIAIGGFFKTVLIADSDAEKLGADFLPSTLGTNRPDTDGGFSLDSTITRVFLDARSKIKNDAFGGYLEFDLNKTNNGIADYKMRHAYATWKNNYGTLLAGHTWSTMMDLKILPEGLTEPTVSGVIFNRQSVLRWTQPLSSEFTYFAALEDPSSDDVFSSQSSLGETSVPDIILGLEYSSNPRSHIRLNGIMRQLEVTIPSTGDDDHAVGWGLSLTGHLNVAEKDRLSLSGTYGEGLGRYFLGISSTDGSAINPARNEIDLRENWGGMISYLHHWNNQLRSSVMAGYANTDPFSWQDGGTLESTTYAATNLMWKIKPYLTFGVEYGYGRRDNSNDSSMDNHRVAIGFQIY